MKILSLFAAILFLLTSCATSQQTKSGRGHVPYTTAKNYFVRNTVNTNGAIKISSQAELENLFGIATTMSPTSKPTEIDFKKSFAVAVIAPVSSNKTDIKIKKISKQDGHLFISYEVQSGDAQTFSSRAFHLLIFDRKYDAPLKATQE